MKIDQSIGGGMVANTTRAAEYVSVMDTRIARADARDRHLLESFKISTFDTRPLINGRKKRRKAASGTADRRGDPKDS